MKKWLILLLCGVMLLSLAACSGEEPDNDALPPDEESTGPAYVTNEIVNQFLVDFSEVIQLVPSPIERDTEKDQFIFSYNSCEIQMTSTMDGLYIRIQGGKTEKDRARLFHVFEQVCVAADESCTEAQITAAEDFMNQQTATAGDYRISNFVKLLAYTPIIDNETVHVECSIELLALMYHPNPEE